MEPVLVKLDFFCHWCGEALSTDKVMQGKTISCTGCGTKVTVPDRREIVMVPESEPRVVDLSLLCPHCDMLVESTTERCPGCGQVLTYSILPQENLFFDPVQRENSAVHTVESTLPCPMCGEKVSDRLRECPSCGETLSRSASSRELTTLSPALIQKFRQEVHALGAFWIFIGLVSAGLGIVAFYLLELDPEQAEKYLPDFALLAGGIILMISGIFSMLLGFCSLLKQSWAIHLGLGYSYLHLVFSVFTLNPLAAVIYILVILQARRVARYAGEIEEAGYPLSIRIGNYAT